MIRDAEAIEAVWEIFNAVNPLRRNSTQETVADPRQGHQRISAV